MSITLIDVLGALTLSTDRACLADTGTHPTRSEASGLLVTSGHLGWIAAVPILFPSEQPSLLVLCRNLSWATWSVFVVDFIVRMSLAERRLRYAAHHWYDVLVIVLPLLRPLRLLRLVPLLSVVNRRARTRLRGRVAIYVVGGASLLAFVAALAVLDVERTNPTANIVDFGDASWWALTTMTTAATATAIPSPASGG